MLTQSDQQRTDMELELPQLPLYLPSSLSSSTQDFTSKDGTDLSPNGKQQMHCIICMDTFTLLKPKRRIPCQSGCKDTKNYVHDTCLYNWYSAQAGQGLKPSCPLCRGELRRVERPPILSLPSSKQLSKSEPIRNMFVKRPLPKSAGVVRCYMRVKKATTMGGSNSYQLFLQSLYPEFGSKQIPDVEDEDDDDIFLLSAYRSSSISINRSFSIYNQRKYSANQNSLVAQLQAGFFGLNYSLVVPSIDKLGKTKFVESLGVSFKNGVCKTTKGPRRMKVVLPSPELEEMTIGSETIESDKALFEARDLWISPLGNIGSDNFSKIKNIKHPYLDTAKGLSESFPTSSPQEQGSFAASSVFTSPSNAVNNDIPQIRILSSVMPTVSADGTSFELDFGGRVTRGSAKNFQLVFDDSADDDDKSSIILQFGRTANEYDIAIYTMDVQWPFSIVQAFGVCLAMCDRKISIS